MNKPVCIYLDLDHTLLDTDAIMSAIFAQCEQLYNVPEAVLRKEMPAYYSYVGQLRYYDFFKQMAAHNLKPAQVESDLLAGISQDLLYPDAHQMLRSLNESPYRLYVLSFGKHDFQQLKYRLAPQLRHIPFISLLYPKNQYVSEGGQVPSLLIDDVFITDLPTYAWQIHINRSAAQEITYPDAQHIGVRSLQSVEKILTSAL